jgi:hypothetical protein
VLEQLINEELRLSLNKARQSEQVFYTGSPFSTVFTMSKVSNLKLENLNLTQDEIDCLHKPNAQELRLSLGMPRQSQAVEN